MPVNGAVRITLQGGCQAYTDNHLLEGQLEYSLEVSTYQLNPINTTELLSTPYYTITPDKWNTWKKIHDAIGSPEGILFKDVGPMYWKYKKGHFFKWRLFSDMFVIIMKCSICIINLASIVT